MLEELLKFSSFLASLGLMFGGIWALFMYAKNRRAAAAQWLHGLFQDFYASERFHRGRDLLEYENSEVVTPLVSLRVIDRHVVLNDEQRDDLRDLDLILNYFEHIVYLESEKHIRKHDREVFFQYWLELLGEPEYAALRRYLARCGYELLADLVGAEDSEIIAFYGNLRREFRYQDDLEVRDKLRFIRLCTVTGELYDFGEYPGLLPGQDPVVIELYEVVDNRVFQILDRFENYDPARPSESEYIRRCVHIEEAAVDAWIYWMNTDVSRPQKICSGDWVSHVRNRQPLGSSSRPEWAVNR